MSKIIRTVRVTGPVVTLGEAERELYLADKTALAPPLIDLPRLLETRVSALRQRLDGEWSARLQQEREALQTAADQRLQEAETRAETERQQVHQRRYEEGYQAGVDAKEAEAREAVDRLDTLHRAMEQERAQILRGAETLVVDLALAVARRVTAVQVEMDDKVLLRGIRAALELLASESRVEVKVHPEDLQIARRFAQRWVEKVAREAVIKVLPSDSVGRGGCMIEGEEGNVDARVESQLEALHQALRIALTESAPADSGEKG